MPAPDICYLAAFRGKADLRQPGENLAHPVLPGAGQAFATASIRVSNFAQTADG